MAASAATFGGLAAGTAAAAEDQTVDVGVFREGAKALSGEPTSDDLVEARAAVEEFGVQLDGSVDVSVVADSARPDLDYDDKTASIRAFETALQDANRLHDHDVYVLLYYKPVPDTSVASAEMGGAGFNAWQWGTDDTHMKDTANVEDSFERDHEHGQYAFAFVNTATRVTPYNDRIYRNTVMHEVGHTFDLNHSGKTDSVEVPERRGTTTITFEEPGSVIDTVDGVAATPMATWYADDLRGSNYGSQEPEEFCTRPAEFPTDSHTDRLTQCSRLAATEWLREHSESAELPTVDGSRPQDVNDDGLYRDITGDGSVGQSDVVRFFEHQHLDYMKRPEYFDYSGNGSVGHGDIISLFEYVATRSV